MGTRIGARVGNKQSKSTIVSCEQNKQRKRTAIPEGSATKLTAVWHCGIPWCVYVVCLRVSRSTSREEEQLLYCYRFWNYVCYYFYYYYYVKNIYIILQILKQQQPLLPTNVTTACSDCCFCTCSSPPASHKKNTNYIIIQLSRPSNKYIKSNQIKQYHVEEGARQHVQKQHAHPDAAAHDPRQRVGQLRMQSESR